MLTALKRATQAKIRYKIISINNIAGGFFIEFSLKLLFMMASVKKSAGPVKAIELASLKNTNKLFGENGTALWRQFDRIALY